MGGRNLELDRMTKKAIITRLPMHLYLKLRQIALVESTTTHKVSMQKVVENLIENAPTPDSSQPASGRATAEDA
jgi:hypothetical protein